MSHVDEMKARAGQHFQAAQQAKGHTHLNEQGLWVRCYHRCRTSVLQPGFWIGVTLSFPVEHLLWERVWPLKLVTKWMGL